MRKGIFLAMASAAILSLTACGGSKAAQGNKESIEKTQWKLESMNGEKKAAFAREDSFTFELLPQESRIAGKGACNRFFGDYKLEKDGMIDMKMGGSTRMACPDMDLEQPFFMMLDEADKYKIENGKLTLYKGNTPVGVFVKYKAAPDMHTAENSLDVAGTYTGTLPAADCPGIKTSLTLNKDNTFAVSMEYIDRNTKFTDKGTYAVKGNILTLTDGKDKSKTLYKIGENSLTMLDADGKEVTGAMADMYVLHK